MKDFFKVEEYDDAKYYYNEHYQYHRLNCPAIERYDWMNSYWINNIRYMNHFKHTNTLYVYPDILRLISKY